MFLKNGGYEQNPTMGGNIIKVARGKTYLGQNESWQDEMERTMLYLGMEEDENEQPPVAESPWLSSRNSSCCQKESS